MKCPILDINLSNIGFSLPFILWGLIQIPHVQIHTLILIVLLMLKDEIYVVGPKMMKCIRKYTDVFSVRGGSFLHQCLGTT